ncbi:hypothetical protein Gpo141_00007243 [Globisporangium polare]
MAANEHEPTDAKLHAALQQLLNREAAAVTSVPTSEPAATVAPADPQLHGALQELLSRGAGGARLAAHSVPPLSSLQDGISSDIDELLHVASLEDHFVVTDEEAVSMAAGVDTFLEGLDSSSDFEQRAATKKRSQEHQQYERQQHEEEKESLTAKRPRQTRKSTYQTRKEEKTALKLQVQLLQTQLGKVNGDEQFSSERSLLQSQLENKALRNAVQGQGFSFARVQSAFGEHVASKIQIPFESYIKLGTDWNERQATLLAMKDKKLQDAQRYVAERTHFLDTTTPFTEASKFATPNGDMRALILDIMPFEGVQSVRQVYDALLFYLFNMEISVSEVLGEITIRENDGSRMHGISQNRLFSSVCDGVQVEFNGVTFCQFYEASDGEDEFAVVTADCVNEDALYPYLPEQRLRKDVTAAITLKLETRKTVNTNGEEQEEKMVVLRRAALICLHKTDLPIPAPVLHGLRDDIGSWGDAMIKTVRSLVYPEHSVIGRSGRIAASIHEVTTET